MAMTSDSYIHPEDFPQVTAEWSRCLKTGDAFWVELRFKRHDGAWRWMQARSSPLRDNSGSILKWFGSYTDIHDHVEAKLAAKRAREHLRNVITHAQVTVWTIDLDLTLTLMEGKPMWEADNPEIMQEAIGQNIFVTLSKYQKGEEWERYRDLVEKILKGEIPGWASEHQVIGGEGPWYRTRLSPLKGAMTVDNQMKRKSSTDSPGAGDAIEGLIGISVDVTEAKEAEQALRAQGAENIRLLAAEHAAKGASKLKSQFLANMSHEIRTPIAGVIGMAELLLDTGVNGEQRDYVENIQRSANSLLTIINDVLDLSKVESGKLDIEEVPFSLPIVVQDVCKMLSFAAGRKGLEFIGDIRESIGQDLVIIGDPGRIRQILTNLLTNSIKFTSDGYVKLAVSITEESCKHAKVSFVVEDTGVGIEEAVQNRLFQPFSQADPSTARRYGGVRIVHYSHLSLKLNTMNHHLEKYLMVRSPG